jgi:type 2 lantibiotic biosynthesis protein LanM
VTSGIAECVADIARRATFLSEHLAKDRVHGAPVDAIDDGVDSVDDRLDQLRRTVANGDAARFSRWLDWNRVDMDRLRQALRDATPAEREVTARWEHTLTEVLDTGDPDAMPVCSRLPGEPLIPFEDAFVSILPLARRKLLSRLDDVDPCTLLSSDAYGGLERGLLGRLSFVAARTLSAEFVRYRPVGLNFLVSVGAMTGRATTPADTTHYRRFTSAVRRDGFRSLFAQYPVLGRLVAVTIDLWVESTAEFIERLSADWEDITARFSDRALARVTTINANLSDAHHGGRSAIALVFDTGLAVVYKPKSVALERCYIEILAWCNHRGLSLPCKTHQVLDRRTHGWAEFVREEPCDDAAAVARFYRRAGMQLCLLYVLGASDCHGENLVACGEHLVLVDMETLLFPEPRSVSDEDDAGPMDSVFRAGLLPSWDCRADTRIAADVSGLGFEECVTETRQWVLANTDGMHIGWGPFPTGTHRNAPKVNGITQSAVEHLADLTAGFEEMYRLVMQHRWSLVQAGGPIAALDGQLVRFVFRPTLVYGAILQRALEPGHLRSGTDYSMQLELLSRPLLSVDTEPQSWHLLSNERAALEQLDIPHFGCRSDSASLTAGVTQPLGDYFREPSYRECTSRLARLSEADLTRQLDMIRGSMYCKVASVHADSEPATTSDAGASVSAGLAGGRLARLGVEREARAITEELLRRSMRGSRGEIDWLGVSYAHRASRFHIRQIGDTLFDGRCGVALFLAACAYVLDDRRARDLVLETLDPLRRRLRSAPQGSAPGFGDAVPIGGAMGLGSIIYAFARISRFLNEPALLHEAGDVADRLTPARIAADRYLDVMNGAAGAILALLTLHAETGPSRFLHTARACGEHLVDTPAWRRPQSASGQAPVIGFGHGAAGICYALLRLYAATDEPRFLRAAADGRAYERSRFRLADGRVPNSVERGEVVTPGLIGSWCNGVAGMGLSRLGCVSLVNETGAEEEIDAALDIVEHWAVDGIDHVCCGAFGRVEMLLVAAETLSRARYRDVAHAKASSLVDRARHRGGYRLYGGSVTAPLFKPAFFQGVAGIGYELLRVTEPKVLPSVLLWE